MPQFEYSRWDGSQEFTPQSADQLFDELSQYMMDYGEHMLDHLEQWEEEHPDLIEKLIKQGYVEKDAEGKFRVTPKGLRRVENKALESLFDIRRKDKLGRHETDFRGAGQTYARRAAARRIPTCCPSAGTRTARSRAPGLNRPPGRGN